MLPALHPEPSRSPLAPDVARWRQAISAGNQAFQRAIYFEALEHYSTALVWALGLYGHLDDAHVGTAALVIAHHNLADTYGRLERPAEQCQHLCAVHERLLKGAEDGALPSAWREAASTHSRRTRTELARFIVQHPGHAQALVALAQGGAPAAGRHQD